MTFSSGIHAVSEKLSRLLRAMTRNCREEKGSIRVPLRLIRGQAVLVVDNGQAREKILLQTCMPLQTLTATREESGVREGRG
jgi:hypothetical protein